MSKTEKNANQDLIDQVDYWVKIFESGDHDYDLVDDEALSNHIINEQVMEIRFVIDSNKDYLGSFLLVGFGGPNIWIDTYEEQVKGYWGGDVVIKSYQDNIYLNGSVEEVYECC